MLPQKPPRPSPPSKPIVPPKPIAPSPPSKVVAPTRPLVVSPLVSLKPVVPQPTTTASLSEDFSIVTTTAIIENRPKFPFSRKPVNQLPPKMSALPTNLDAIERVPTDPLLSAQNAWKQTAVEKVVVDQMDEHFKEAKEAEEVEDPIEKAKKEWKTVGARSVMPKQVVLPVVTEVTETDVKESVQSEEAIELVEVVAVVSVVSVKEPCSPITAAEKNSQESLSLSESKDTGKENCFLFSNTPDHVDKFKFF